MGIRRMYKKGREVERERRDSETKQWLVHFKLALK